MGSHIEHQLGPPMCPAQTDFFDIVAPINDQISHVQHITGLLCVFCTSLGAHWVPLVRGPYIRKKFYGACVRIDEPHFVHLPMSA